MRSPSWSEAAREILLGTCLAGGSVGCVVAGADHIAMHSHAVGIGLVVLGIFILGVGVQCVDVRPSPE